MKTSRILARKQAKRIKKNRSKKNNNLLKVTKADLKPKTKLKQIISFFRCRGWSISRNKVSS